MIHPQSPKGVKADKSPTQKVPLLEEELNICGMIETQTTYLIYLDILNKLHP